MTASTYSAIGGGSNNVIAFYSSFSVIGGGSGNEIQDEAYYSVIGGGQNNTIETDAFYAVISGGTLNTVGKNSEYGVISGGTENSMLNNNHYSVIGGGYANTIYQDSEHSVIPGGIFNSISNAPDSFAAGHSVNIKHSGSFVWADGKNFSATTINSNSFTVRATGGARFISGVDGSGSITSGVVLASGGNSWASLSDRNAKENFVVVNPVDVLNKVLAMPITTWNMKTEDPAIRHIGPMAQDVYQAFQVGSDEHYIVGSDADGIALAAVQGLYQLIDQKDQALRKQGQEIESLRREMNDLKARLPLR